MTNQPSIGELERRMCRVWANVLGVDEVHADSDFYELGGDSLALAMLSEWTEEEFELPVTPAALFDVTTPRAFVANLLEGSADGRGALVALQPYGTHCPLFIVHDYFGYVSFARHLVSQFGGEQPIYALGAPSVLGTATRAQTLEELAAMYVAEIRRVQPEGPYHLYGQCLGAIIAFEMAIQLRDAGAEIALLAAGDAVAPSILAETNVSDFLLSITELPPPLAVRLRRKLGSVRHASGAGAVTELANATARELGRWLCRGHTRLDAAERRRAQWRWLQVRRERDSPWSLKITELCEAYRPTRAFDGGVFLIRSDEEFGAPEADRGWARDVVGSVRCVRVACRHSDIDKPVFLSAVATAIAPDLQKSASR